MDQRLDEITANVKGYCIRASVALWTFIQSLVQWCKRSYKAVQGAHQQELWFFMDNNHYPYMTGIPEHFPTNYKLVYNPLKKVFGINDANIPPLGSQRTRRLDILSAELFCSITNKRWDIAEHLTQVSWKGTNVPSIYEIILTWILHQDAPPFSHSILSKMKLRVETDNFTIHTYNLDEAIVKRKFESFA